MRVPWTLKIKPVNPKGNQPRYSLEGLMLKLELQYSGHLTQSGSIGKECDTGKEGAGGEGGDRG